MEKKILSTDEIAKILGVSVITARTYLCHSLFSDYRGKFKHRNHIRDVCTFDKGFAYAMSEYLIKRNNFIALKRFEEYCEKMEKENE